jgi:hypothetical protein
VARGLFGADEVNRLRDHIMALRRRGPYEPDVVGVQPGSRDPLRRYEHLLVDVEMSARALTSRLKQACTARELNSARLPANTH